MRRTAEILLIVSGVVNFLFFIFHLTFYHLFNWEESLSCLSRLDRSIMLTFNSICILFIGLMGYTLLKFRQDLLNRDLGRVILMAFTTFYGIRVFAEFYHFGYQGGKSVVILILCLIPVLCNLYGFFCNIRGYR